MEVGRVQEWQWEGHIPLYPLLALGSCRLLSRQFCEHRIKITKNPSNSGRHNRKEEITGSKKIKQMSKAWTCAGPSLNKDRSVCADLCGSGLTALLLHLAQFFLKYHINFSSRFSAFGDIKQVHSSKAILWGITVVFSCNNSCFPKTDYSLHILIFQCKTHPMSSSDKLSTWKHHIRKPLAPQIKTLWI